MIKSSKEKVKLLHQLISEETGGSVGIRDEGSFESALEGAFATFDGKDLYPTKKKQRPVRETCRSFLFTNFLVV